MDIKDVAIGGLLGLLLAGGGLYGLYLRQTTHVIRGELDGYSLMGECAVLNVGRHPDTAAVETFEKKVEEQAPRIFASLMVAGAVSGQDRSGEKPMAVQVDELLKGCVQSLRRKVGSA